EVADELHHREDRDGITYPEGPDQDRQQHHRAAKAGYGGKDAGRQGDEGDDDGDEEVAAHALAPDVATLGRPDRAPRRRPRPGASRSIAARAGVRSARW